jgi:hypothetical protein
MENYTDTLDEETKSLAQQIHGKDLKGFKTHAFAHDDHLNNDDASGEPGRYVRWMEASRARNGLWNIWQSEISHGLYRNDTGVLEESDGIETKRIAQNLHFIDALHRCAQYALFEKDLGKTPLNIKTPSQGDMPYYDDAAHSVGIPFDQKSGMPIPAIDGQILLDRASLPANIADILENTVNSAEGTNVNNALTTALSPQQITPYESGKNGTDLIINKAQKISNAQTALTNLKNAWIRNSEQKFMPTTENQECQYASLGALSVLSGLSSGFGVLFYAGMQAPSGTFLDMMMPAWFMMSAGCLLFTGREAVEALDYRYIKEDDGTRRAVNKQFRTIEKCTKRLEAGSLKEHFQQAASDARLSYKLLCARASHRASLSEDANFWVRRRAQKDRKALLQELDKNGLGHNAAQFEAFIHTKIKDTEIDQQLETYVLKRLSTLINDLDQSVHSGTLQLTATEPLKLPALSAPQV